MPRGAGKRALIRGCPNGKTHIGNPYVLCTESPFIRTIGGQWEPSELNHLSNWRKRKKAVFKTEHSLSSGERKGNSPWMKNEYIIS